MTSTALDPGAGGLLATAEAAVGALCEGTDPSVLLGSDALDGLARTAVVVRRLAALQSALAVRVVESNTWRGRGSPTGELWLAKQLGCTTSSAHRLLATAKKLDELPATKQAFASGAISGDEADAIVAAAVVDPTAEAALLAIAAKDHDLAVTRKAADKVRHQSRSVAQEQARMERIRRARRWTEFEDRDDGAAGVSATFVPSDYTVAKVVLDAFERQVFTAARLTGTRDPSAAYRADAFLAAMAAAGASIGITSTPTAGEPATASRVDEPFPIDGSITGARSDTGADAGPPVTPAAANTPAPPALAAIVLVDAVALLRGYAAPGETCTIPGVGDVSVAWAKQIADSGIFEVLVHNGVDIVTYASSTRHRPRPVEIAVKTRDRTCIVPGCRRVQRVEYDHRTNYSETRRTDYKTLGLLCGHHHDEKTHRGARLERHGNEWWWYPPPDTDTHTTTATRGPDAPIDPTVPWRAPVGEHLTLWNPDHLPTPTAGTATGTESDNGDHPNDNTSGDPDDPGPPTLFGDAA